MLIDKLYQAKNLDNNELKELIENPEQDKMLFKTADSVRKEYYGNDVYIRGLIEISNYCKNNCYYCGIRKDNKKINRYRLSKEEILSSCEQGFALGFRTFVLQGGEDLSFTDSLICEITGEIKTKFPGCAVTLSLGEKSHESYKAYFDSGADRYLLRHETACEDHYKFLHPEDLSLKNRKECLFNLKKIGYQTGSGFMTGSPYQTTEHIISDIRFLQLLKPDMIGIGPYITHKDTPFNNFKSGSLELCLRLISILRLLFPNALIPATTALGTIAQNGRESGLAAGANVIMPNLTPLKYRKQYEIYNNKLYSDEEAGEGLENLKKRVSKAGYKIVTSIGHVKKIDAEINTKTGGLTKNIRVI